MGKLLESTPAEVTATAHAASGVAGDWARSGADVRAKLLRGLAEALEAHRNDLVALADRETSLGIARLSGEIDRTAFQLRGFASIVEQGAPFSVVDDEAVVAAPPVGRPRLTRVRVPLGPVAMFSASNFPFAFSVLGGDTASALAAGCPVVVKAHPGHPAVSRAVHSLATQVLEAQGLSPDLIGMVEGASTDVGVSLVREPMIAAVAFTGSYQGGRALEQVTQTRPRPIPFFGELGSVNPVIATPSLLAERGAELAKSLAASITLGCGQFCTSPGLIVLESDVTSDTFVADLGTALEALKPHAMLSPQIRGGFDTGVARWRNHGKAKVLVGPAADA
jgi:acyl-CoA reductase-like NAD-dependent aldehyde dehydrogenase